MTIQYTFRDITPEEENRLPLPQGWISVIQVGGANHSYKINQRRDTAFNNDNKQKVYKNVDNGMEMFENPILYQANQLARKRPLPIGWIECKDQGTSQIFYLNKQQNITMWNHPNLRICICDLLISQGFDFDQINEEIIEIAHPQITSNNSSRSNSRSSTPARTYSNSNLNLDEDDEDQSSSYSSISNRRNFTSTSRLSNIRDRNFFPNRSDETNLSGSKGLSGFREGGMKKVIKVFNRTAPKQDSEKTYDNVNNLLNTESDNINEIQDISNKTSLNNNSTLNELSPIRASIHEQSPQQQEQDVVEENDELNDNHRTEEQYEELVSDFQVNMINYSLPNEQQHESTDIHYEEEIRNDENNQVFGQDELEGDEEIDNDYEETPEEKPTTSMWTNPQPNDPSDTNPANEIPANTKESISINEEAQLPMDRLALWEKVLEQPEPLARIQAMHENPHKPRRVIKSSNSKRSASSSSIRGKGKSNSLASSSSSAPAVINAVTNDSTTTPTQLPINTASIKIMKQDVLMSIDRVHTNLRHLRTLLSIKKYQESMNPTKDNTTECYYTAYLPQNDTVIYRNQSMSINTILENPTEYHHQLQVIEHVRGMITLASDIVTIVKQQPEFIVMTLAQHNNWNNFSRKKMLPIAFITLHRLLHPFSTDNSLTTALLLESINYQLEELSKVEQLLSNNTKPNLASIYMNNNSSSNGQPSTSNNADVKRILGRALLISDPQVALTWDALITPLPLTPMVSIETVTSCLLRCYAMRRDVTCYFRAIWMPVLPAIATLLDTSTTAFTIPSDNHSHLKTRSSNIVGSGINNSSSTTGTYDYSDPLLLLNILTIAHRLLECTFCEHAMTVFPPIATAVSRAIYEIGGVELLLAFLFNVMVMPNLMKILCGDHDSIDNEHVFDQFFTWNDNNEQENKKNHLQDDEFTQYVHRVINRYFDTTLWMSSPLLNFIHKNTNKSKSADSEQQQPSEKTNSKYQKLDEKSLHALDIFSTLLWVIWRLFSISAFMTESHIECMTTTAFITDRLTHFNTSSIKDRSLHNLFSRLKRRIYQSVAWLIKMPLDIQGITYLGINSKEQHDVIIAANRGKPLNRETTELLDRRISSIAFKPSEMLNQTIVLKQELIYLLAEIGITLDAQQFDVNNSFYQSISLFLTKYDDSHSHEQQQQQQSQKEEYLQLVFLYSSDIEQEYLMNQEFPDQQDSSHIDDSIIHRYWQLYRGLTLCYRYEKTLRNLVRKVENSVISNIYELLQDYSWWYYEPEFDLEFKVNKVEIAEKHTLVSSQRTKTPHFGLRQASTVQVFPLLNYYTYANYLQQQQNESEQNPSSQNSDLRKLLSSKYYYSELHQEKSLRAMQDDVIASYRFNTSHRSVNAGTSLARNKVLKPKIHPRDVKTTLLSALETMSATSSRPSQQHQHRNTTSQITQPVIKPNSSLLAPTQASLYQQKIPPPVPPSSHHHSSTSSLDGNVSNPSTTRETRFELDKKFMESMRAHKIIPAEEYQNRYFRKKKAWYDSSLPSNRAPSESHRQQQQQQQPRGVSSRLYPGPNQNTNNNQNIHGGSVANENTPSGPKPFPEHLRHRIRGYQHDNNNSNNQNNNNYNMNVDDYPDSHYQSEYQDDTYSQSRSRSRSPGRSTSHQQTRSYFKDLISQYHSTVLNISANRPVESFQATQSYPQESNIDYIPSNKSERSSTSPVGFMPAPISGESNQLFAPTFSVQQRQKQLALKLQHPDNIYHPEPQLNLRQHPPNELTVKNHPRAFTPTKTRFYPSTGNRLPRVPDYMPLVDGQEEQYIRSPTGSRGGSRSPSLRTTRSTTTNGNSNPSRLMFAHTASSLQGLSDRGRQYQQEQRRKANMLLSLAQTLDSINDLDLTTNDNQEDPRLASNPHSAEELRDDREYDQMQPEDHQPDYEDDRYLEDNQNYYYENHDPNSDQNYYPDDFQHQQQPQQQYQNEYHQYGEYQNDEQQYPHQDYPNDDQQYLDENYQPDVNYFDDNFYQDDQYQQDQYPEDDQYYHEGHQENHQNPQAVDDLDTTRDDQYDDNRQELQYSDDRQYPSHIDYDSNAPSIVVLPRRQSVGQVTLSQDSDNQIFPPELPAQTHEDDQQSDQNSSFALAINDNSHSNPQTTKFPRRGKNRKPSFRQQDSNHDPAVANNTINNYENMSEGNQQHISSTPTEEIPPLPLSPPPLSPVIANQETSTKPTLQQLPRSISGRYSIRFQPDTPITPAEIGSDTDEMIIPSTDTVNLTEDRQRLKEERLRRLLRKEIDDDDDHDDDEDDHDDQNLLDGTSPYTSGKSFKFLESPAASYRRTHSPHRSKSTTFSPSSSRNDSSTGHTSRKDKKFSRSFTESGHQSRKNPREYGDSPDRNTNNNNNSSNVYDEDKQKAEVRPPPLVKKKSLIGDNNENRLYMVQGFVAIKHGRSGAPKAKLIKFDYIDGGRIVWSTAPHHSPWFSFLSNNKNKDNDMNGGNNSFITIDSILEVRKGANTEVFQRAGLLDPLCCLSVITKDRTLDLTLPTSVDRDRVLRGLRAILENHEHVKFT